MVGRYLTYNRLLSAPTDQIRLARLPASKPRQAVSCQERNAVASQVNGVAVAGRWHVPSVPDAITQDRKVAAENALQVSPSAAPDSDPVGILTVATRGMGVFIVGISPMIRHCSEEGISSAT